MKTKIIRISTFFPFSVDTIWDKLKRFDTLRYISAPLITFAPMNDTEFSWEESKTFTFRLKLFGFIPSGVHSIKVIKFNKETLSVYTNETNRIVPVWNHRIILESMNNGMIRYTDEVELFAHWKTWAVYFWSKCFYRHRQKRWLQLLSEYQ